MKKNIIFLFILLSQLSFSQMYVTNFVRASTLNYVQISSNQHQFNFETRIANTFFINPWTNTISFSNNTLHVSLLYDLTIPVFGDDLYSSIYYDTIQYEQAIPSNVEYIKMSTNVLIFEDNPPYNPITVEDVYFKIIDLNNLGTNFSSIENTTVFPNPTNDTITITFGESQETYTIVLQTILGQTVSKKIISGVSEVTYPIENEKGIYLLTIENEKGETSTQKIVKN